MYICITDKDRQKYCRIMETTHYITKIAVRTHSSDETADMFRQLDMSGYHPLQWTTSAKSETGAWVLLSNAYQFYTKLDDRYVYWTSGSDCDLIDGVNCIICKDTEEFMQYAARLKNEDFILLQSVVELSSDIVTAEDKDAVSSDVYEQDKQDPETVRRLIAEGRLRLSLDICTGDMPAPYPWTVAVELDGQAVLKKSISGILNGD